MSLVETRRNGANGTFSALAGGKRSFETLKRSHESHSQVEMWPTEPRETPSRLRLKRETAPRDHIIGTYELFIIKNTTTTAASRAF